MVQPAEVACSCMWTQLSPMQAVLLLFSDEPFYEDISCVVRQLCVAAAQPQTLSSVLLNMHIIV